MPSFGDVSNATVATLGLNPSNREFVDANGNELQGDQRRFHTLNSLNIKNWGEVNDNHLEMIEMSCKNYFHRNPYDSWFKSLDKLISHTNASYYSSMFEACHLDLIPYATSVKWTSLSNSDKKTLLENVGDLLGLIVRDSKIEVLILNGQTVINTLCELSDPYFKKLEYSDWELPRKNGSGVKGYAYVGNVSSICGIDIGREVRVLGYNHNIQSSFGVTNKVRQSIQEWIGDEVLEVA